MTPGAQVELFYLGILFFTPKVAHH